VIPTVGEAFATHCWLGALETEMSTARIGHRAVRELVDYRRFNLNHDLYIITQNIHNFNINNTA